MVFATAWRVLGHAEDSEDVLQEVFLKLLKANVNIDTARDWGAYLRTMTTRCAIDRLRKHRSATWIEASDWIEQLPASENENPARIVDRRQKADLLRRAMSTLPARDATVFALRHFDELSYEQIATQTGVNVSRVGVILHRTRERLTDMLAPVAAQEA